MFEPMHSTIGHKVLSSPNTFESPYSNTSVIPFKLWVSGLEKFFQQGSDHNTAGLIRKRTPDSATIIAQCTAAHDGNVENYICYLFENTTESLPTLHLANRESGLFATMRGSKLSPISMPSEFSSTHSGLSKVAQWGDRLFKDETIKNTLAQVEADKLIWMECDDCHVLVVTKDFHPSIAGLEKTIFHHFAQYRFRK